MAQAAEKAAAEKAKEEQEEERGEKKGRKGKLQERLSVSFVEAFPFCNSFSSIPDPNLCNRSIRGQKSVRVWGQKAWGV